MILTSPYLFANILIYMLYAEYTKVPSFQSGDATSAWSGYKIKLPNDWVLAKNLRTLRMEPYL
jgi:hypothetical protein